jgi:hypothetical protein
MLCPANGTEGFHRARNLSHGVAHQQSRLGLDVKEDVAITERLVSREGNGAETRRSLRGEAQFGQKAVP